MCLYVSRYKENIVWDTPFQEFYKILLNFDGTLVSPHYRRFHWKAGFNQMEIREVTTLKESNRSRDTYIVSEGIHVYLNRIFTYDMCSCLYGSRHITLPVRCYYEDLIAYGSSIPYSHSDGFKEKEAVFSKVEISPEVWEQAQHLISRDIGLKTTFQNIPYSTDEGGKLYYVL